MSEVENYKFRHERMGMTDEDLWNPINRARLIKQWGGEKIDNIKQAIDYVRQNPAQATSEVVGFLDGELEKLMSGPIAYSKEDKAPVNFEGDVEMSPSEMRDYETALASIAASPFAVGAKNLGKLDQDTLNIFGGPQAKNFPRDSLRDAIDMESRGFTPEQIRNATMLEYDPQNKTYQFVIDPNEIKFNNVDYKQFDNKWDGEQEVLNSLSGHLKNILNEGDKPTAVLSDLVEFPKLFENYPSLKDTKVVFREGPGGSFNAQDNKMEVGIDSLNDPLAFKELITHELQHGVQAHEGWSGGANSIFYLNKMPEFNQAAKDLVKGNITREEFEDTAINLKRKAYNTYLQNTGEVEARAASKLLRLENKNNLKEGNLSIQKLKDLEKEDNFVPEDMPTASMSQPDEFYDLVEPLTSEEIELIREEALRNKDQLDFDFGDDNVFINDFPDSEPRNFNKGGLAMNVDPVSGNEIPLGADAKNVRDDIPAKLSEGEFVIPANVVNYYGVAMFEDMIKSAEKGWEELQSEGRLGGEEPDDLPFDISELEYEEELENTEQPVEMNTGGYVSGFSTGDLGFLTKTYVNDKGDKRSILFIGGVPMQSIPSGFVEDNARNRREIETERQQQSSGPVTTPQEQMDQGSGGYDSSRDDYFDRDDVREARSSEGWGDLVDFEDQVDRYAKATGMVPDAIGTIVGGAVAGPMGAAIGNKLAGLGAEAVTTGNMRRAGYTDAQIEAIQAAAKERAPTGFGGFLKDTVEQGLVETVPAALRGDYKKDKPASTPTPAPTPTSTPSYTPTPTSTPTGVTTTPVTTSSIPRTSSREDNERNEDRRDSYSGAASRASETGPDSSRDVVDAARDRGASEREIREIEDERDRVEGALGSMASGATSIGFNKGGYVSKGPKRRKKKSNKKGLASRK